MKINPLIKQIEKRQSAIAKERDKLEALIEDAEALRSICQEAIEHLEEARDCLSQLV